MIIHAKKIHLLLGLAGFLIFLFSGQYMRHFMPEMHLDGHDRLRFSTRGSHIYILMSALLNLSLGSYLRVSAARWRAALQAIGSVLIIAATVLLVAAFFYESKDSPERPVTLSAMIAGLAGTSLHLLSSIKDKSSSLP